jgi:hypothetical protein
MTFLEILSSASGIPVATLQKFFADVKAKAPDLAPLVDKFLADLAAGVTAETIAKTIAALPPELLDILRGQIKPKDHPDSGI